MRRSGGRPGLGSTMPFCTSMAHRTASTALSVATTEAKGPVYLSLPREVLAEPLAGFAYDAPSRRVAATPPCPDQGAIDEAARILASAENPLIITATVGRTSASVSALAELPLRFAIPVVQHRPRHLSLSADHPCHLGYDASPRLDGADAILVLECDVPWVPSLKAPRPDCRVIHLGIDPLFQRYPIRGFPCDLAITGAPAMALPELAAALERHVAKSAIKARREVLAQQREEQRAVWQKAREAAAEMRPKALGKLSPDRAASQTDIRSSAASASSAQRPIADSSANASYPPLCSPSGSVPVRDVCARSGHRPFRNYLH